MHSHIGKYELQKLLGRGATGSVWLAKDPFAGREVALKVLDEMPSDPSHIPARSDELRSERLLAAVELDFQTAA